LEERDRTEKKGVREGDGDGRTERVGEERSEKGVREKEAGRRKQAERARKEG
jgi:hypothetical protein